MSRRTKINTHSKSEAKRREEMSASTSNSSLEFVSPAEGAPKKCPVPEETLSEEPVDVLVTPEYVRTLQGPTEVFLCGLEANVYGINFTYFKIREMEHDIQVLEVVKPEEDVDHEPVRYIRYTLPPDILDYTHLGATIRFTAEKDVKDFLMIERHYFRNRLIKEFEFKFPFCIHGSTNEVEHIYEVPKLTDDEKQELIDNPYETKSDSFYFVEGVLVMHNRADYAYNTKAFDMTPDPPC